MVLSICWLLFRRQWRCVVWVGLPTAIVFLLGSTPLADALVAQAERPYARLNITDLPPADVVVALGGGYYASDQDVGGFALAGGASRVLTALELVRKGKAKALVLGGSVPVARRLGLVTTSLVQNWVVDAGLASGTVTNLGLCANTHDEAIHFRSLGAQNDWRKVILVTSALHMPRSIAVFGAQGVGVTPVACDFQVYGVPSTSSYSPFPSQTRFYHLSLYLHEKLGWWAYRWRGWIGPGGGNSATQRAELAPVNDGR